MWGNNWSRYFRSFNLRNSLKQSAYLSWLVLVVGLPTLLTIPHLELRSNLSNFSQADVLWKTPWNGGWFQWMPGNVNKIHCWMNWIDESIPVLGIEDLNFWWASRFSSHLYVRCGWRYLSCFNVLPLRCSGTPHSPCFGRSFRMPGISVREANLVDMYTLEFQTLMVRKRDVTNDEIHFVLFEC